MTDTKKALEMAINVLELYEEKLNSSIAIEVIQICKEALAEQPTNMVTVPLDKLEYMQRRLRKSPIGIDTFSDTEQEPVAWMNDIAFSMDKDELTAEKFGDIIPLYTHPKEWQGLSDDEIIPMYNEPSSDAEMLEFARTIEAKLRERNNG
jgi:hypothetical protein